MIAGQKVYFASDFHLGADGATSSLEREKKIVRWLDSIKQDAHEIYLLGDVFDFWFEYRKVVPRGFVRLIGKLAELTDNGTSIHLVTGNHDMWMFGYLEKEVGVHVHKHIIERAFFGKQFVLGHGDGIGPNDRKYKLLKKMFSSRILQWFFARLHPNLAFAMGHGWAKSSAPKPGELAKPYRGDTKEWQVVWCKQKLKKEHVDYFVFGHRHLALDVPLDDRSRYINCGDWLNLFTYVEFDGNNLAIKTFEDA